MSESLDFGRVCIASDRSSLPEAGEGLALHLDPFDRRRWHDEIVDLWANDERRSALERQIEIGHQRIDSVMTAASVLDALGLSDLMEGL